MIYEDIAVGEFHILTTDGDVITIRDFPENEAMWWCDWLEDNIEIADDEIGAVSWTNFNSEKILAFEWVRYGEEHRSFLIDP